MVIHQNKDYFNEKKGLIFDLDGTLVDSMMHWRSVNWSTTTLEEVYKTLMIDLYKTSIPLKRDALEALQKFTQLGYKCCIATATRTSVCFPCVERLGLTDYIDFVMCCEDVGKSKIHPDIYLEAAKRMGLDKSETIVFEDQFYAAEPAKNAGFTVVAIHDKQSEKDSDKLRTIADDYIHYYSEIFA